MALDASALVPDEARLAELRAYMRVTWTEDDDLISSLYGAAVSYLAVADILPPSQPDRKALYDLAVNGLTLNFYERRAAEVTGTINSQMEFGLRLLINQLKFTTNVSNLDT